MTEHEDWVYLQHIIDSANQIENYLKGFDERKFYSNALIEDAVVKRLEVIGEAIKQVSTDLRQQYPGVEWEQIAGMRNRLIHEYFAIDYYVVWIAATEEVPQLKKQIQQILDEIKLTSK